MLDVTQTLAEYVLKFIYFVSLTWVNEARAREEQSKNMFEIEKIRFNQF